MATTFTLKDDTVIGIKSFKKKGMKFECSFTKEEWNYIDKEQQVFGDDLRFYKSVRNFIHSLKGVEWSWDTAHKRNKRARDLENHKFYERDDWIGQNMKRMARQERELARDAVKDSLKIIKG